MVADPGAFNHPETGKGISADQLVLYVSGVCYRYAVEWSLWVPMTRSTSAARSLAGCLMIICAVLFAQPALAADVSIQAVENDTILSRLDFDKSDIDAEVVHADTGEAVLQLIFPADHAMRLKDLTGANIGRKMRIVIDGIVVVEPIVREPIPGGRIWVSGDFTRDELEAMAEKLQ